jgi:hypothetical protein
VPMGVFFRAALRHAQPYIDLSRIPLEASSISAIQMVGTE